jgi:hypothetical protein
VIRAVSSSFEVFPDQITGHPVQRDISRFFALAGHLQMRHPTPLMLEILHPELAQFLAPLRKNSVL